MNFHPSSLHPSSVAVAYIAMMLTSCQPGWDSQCISSADCPATEFCKLGVCTDLSDRDPGAESPLGVGDDPADSPVPDGGRFADADHSPDHPCPEAEPASKDNLVLNELLANVPQGPDGDANDDGVRHYHDDEFVELVNTADDTIDLTGVAILNDTDVRFTFSEFCLDPLHAVVVFGGIEPGAEPPRGEGFESRISETWFRYAQNGGRAVIRDAEGHTIAEHSYGSHPAGSLNLDGDLDGNSYAPHRDVDDDGALFSPGTCADGRPFPSGCLEGDDEDSNFADSKPSPDP